MKVNRKRNRGFTLVEILIVVVILGILAAIVVPQFTTAANEARNGNTATQISTLENQLELFQARTGAYPTLAELQADSTVHDEFEGLGWGPLIDGDYIKEPPVNPYNDSTSVAAADAPGVGWIYDAATGSLEPGDVP